MLFADKRALETNLKVNLLAIREKELNYYVRSGHPPPHAHWLDWEHLVTLSSFAQTPSSPACRPKTAWQCARKRHFSQGLHTLA